MAKTTAVVARNPTLATTTTTRMQHPNHHNNNNSNNLNPSHSNNLEVAPLPVREADVQLIIINRAEVVDHNNSSPHDHRHQQQQQQQRHRRQQLHHPHRRARDLHSILHRAEEVLPVEAAEVDLHVVVLVLQDLQQQQQQQQGQQQLPERAPPLSTRMPT